MNGSYPNYKFLYVGVVYGFLFMFYLLDFYFSYVFLWVVLFKDLSAEYFYLFWPLGN